MTALALRPRASEAPVLARLLPPGCAVLLILAAAARGEWTLTLAGAAGLCCCAMAWIAAADLLPNMLLPRLLIADSAIQLLALFLMAVLGAPTVVPGLNGIPPDLAEHPAAVCGAQLLIPGAVLAAAGLLRLFSTRPGREPGLLVLLRQPPANLTPFMAACTVLLILRWFASAEALGYFGYVLRLISAPLAFTPFLIGWFAGELPRLRRLCLPLLFVNAAVGAVMGSREGCVCLAFYAVGRMCRLRGPALRRSAAVLLCTALPAVYVSSLIGIVRTQFGRDSFELLRPENVTQLAILLRDQAATRGVRDEEVLRQSIGRMLAWPNAVVVILAPETVPYRGFEDLGDEMRRLARLWGPSREAVEEFLSGGLGTTAATRYGFSVNAGTSVEFGILADGWSRGGIAGAFLFGLLLAFFMIVLERMLGRIRMIEHSGKLVLFAIMAKSALAVHVYPLLLTGRALLLSVGLFAALLLALSRLFSARASA